jgi:hypothetical protein
MTESAVVLAQPPIAHETLISLPRISRPLSIAPPPAEPVAPPPSTSRLRSAPSPFARTNAPSASPSELALVAATQGRPAHREPSKTPWIGAIAIACAMVAGVVTRMMTGAEAPPPAAATEAALPAAAEVMTPHAVILFPEAAAVAIKPAALAPAPPPKPVHVFRAPVRAAVKHAPKPAAPAPAPRSTTKKALTPAEELAEAQLRAASR